MNKITRLRHPVHQPSANWPTTPEIDDYVWTIGPEPTGPTEAESRWAAENLNEDFHTDEPTPDDVLERQYGEAMVRDQLERGIRCF